MKIAYYVLGGNMPGFTTHYLFGIDAYRRMGFSRARKNIEQNHAAFALGLQGPDVFFYYFPGYLFGWTNLGALAHDKNTGAFFSYLLESRTLFEHSPRALAIADAYICGYLGHYTLDCTVHPYVYAFTNYDPKNKKTNSEYFGQHAYFETELDKVLLWDKKQKKPSEFCQASTIHLKPLQKHVISKMLSYAYSHTYYNIVASPRIIRQAFWWMEFGVRAIHDPSGQKKVLTRFTERLTLHRAYLSPMLASDTYRFVEDPMNEAKRTWTHPWTGQKTTATFTDLYKKAGRLYDIRLQKYFSLVANGFSPLDRSTFCNQYFGNRSFLSGEPLF